MEPVDAGTLVDRSEEMAAAYALVQDRIREGLSLLQLQQRQDPLRDLGPRLWHLGTSIVPDFSILPEPDPAGPAYARRQQGP